MRVWIPIVCAILALAAGCSDDAPPAAELNEDLPQPASRPLPESIAAMQADRFVVGMIEFFPSESAADEFPYQQLPADATFIGVLEIDALCLTADGSLVVYDHKVANSVLCKAAANEASFLSALALIKEFYDENLTSETFDEAAAIKVRDRCADIAGGDEYRTFFTMLLGV